MLVRILCTVFLACLLKNTVDANMGAIFGVNMGADSDLTMASDDNNKPTQDESTYSDGEDPEIMLEGDIAFTNATYNEFTAAIKGESSYDAATDKQWSNNFFPYMIARGHEGYLEKAVKAAVDKFNQQLNYCITFKKFKSRWAIRKAKHKNYAMFFVGGGCYSNIGMTGGEQRISIGRGCRQRGTVMHEIMHALGFFHEQSRLDRDQHIEINLRNIHSNMGYNFQKYQIGQADTLGEPYDIKSLMHYPPKAFSRNRKTVITYKKDPSYKKFGWQQELSKIDVNQLRKYYKCDKKGKLAKDAKPVATAPPKINGGWTRWLGWTKCSKTCGGGTWSNSRTCTNPAPANGGRKCRGKSSVVRSCNRRACPVKTACANKDRRCKPSWKRYCYSGGWVSWMTKNCEKLCGKC